MCVVDKIIASLVLFFLCENCLFFLNAQTDRGRKFLSVVFLFAFPMFFFRVLYIYYIYISLTCERLFFNFGSEGNAFCCFTSSCFYRIFFAPKVIGASTVLLLSMMMMSLRRDDVNV